MHTIALNKAGEVVDEVHAMINVKDQKKNKNGGKPFIVKLNFILSSKYIFLG